MATLSITLPSFAADDPGSWQPMLDQARAADAGGVDRLVVSDHVVFGENLEAYARPEVGGMEGGRQPTGPDGLWLEPLIVLTTVAAITSRIRLGTGILLAALRRPIVLAKQAATIDVLSGGRLDLGVGIGWQREEYDAAGLSFERRGRLLDDTLLVCQTLWREQRASVDTADLRFDGIHQMPKPLQPGGVPLWVSGTLNDAVVRRVARFGRGWIMWGPAAADPIPATAEMRRRVADAGGDAASLEVSAPLRLVRRDDKSVDVDATAESLRPLVDAGITDFRGALPVPPDMEEATARYAELVTAFRRVTG
ncbi:MAG TPA: TIGR03619 family F420-dependent LLM class oxidoreductase [Acidimicrobiales bacterium]|nr:TIGR03619 family F420-dependent LLM class oxidoreductase [Acidimicrobiales bacterium]